MCELFRKNRKDIGRLVRRMGSFTKRELVDEFGRDRESVLIDGQVTIGDYLEGLRYAGVLVCRAGVYSPARSLQPRLKRHSYTSVTR